MSGSVSYAETKTAQRIISLSLASDEILLDLLTACKATNRLIALSTFADKSDYSHVADRTSVVKHRVHSEPESIISLTPDLVIAASYNRLEVIDVLKRRGIPTLMLADFASHKDIHTNHCVDFKRDLSTTRLDFLTASILNEISV
jgi:iron complex transport system substrate-binding protein